MTVTAISSRRHPASSATSDSEWTLTLNLRVTGDADPAMIELIRQLSGYERPSTPTSVVPRALRIDPQARSVTRGNRLIMLSRLEFDLLLYLAEHRGQAFTREHLLETVWGGPSTGTRTVDVHVRRLRAKAGDGPLVATIRGFGYRLAEAAVVQVVRAN